MEQLALVHRSTTRRKACNGCVKAKRRCDLTFPTCARCTKKNLSCCYSASSNGPAIEADQSVWNIQSSALIEVPNLTESIQVGSFTNTSNIDLPNQAEDPIHSNVQWAFPDFDPSPVFTNETRPQKKLSLSPYDQFSTLVPTTVDTATYQYVISALTSSMSTLVLTGQNSFIHPALYPHLPSAFQDLICVCSLYMHKTPFNSEAVFHNLATKRRALIAHAQIIHTAEDWLLAVQAMISYTFILQFDPDAQQVLHSNSNSHLETGIGILELWTNTLQQKYFEAETNALTLNSPCQAWFLLESIRRTVLVSSILQCLYASVSMGYTGMVNKLKVLPVCKDPGCWDWAVDAGGEGEVQGLLSAGTTRHDLVTYLDFVEGINAEGGKGKGANGKNSGYGDYEALLLRVCPQSVIGRD